MATMTYIAPATAFSAAAVTTKARPAFEKFGHFFAVFFGANAVQDSPFRGLDLNGNAMWTHKA